MEISFLAPMSNSGQFHYLGEDWSWGFGRDDVDAPIHAASHGTMIYVGVPWQTAALSGHVVILRHTLPPGRDDGHHGQYVYSFYGHILPTERLSVGQDVALGQVIGTIADLATGGFSPHLHSEMRRQDPVDIPDVISPNYVLPGGYVGTGYFQAAGTANAAAQANLLGWLTPSEFVEARLSDGGRDDFAGGPETTGSIVIGEVNKDHIWSVLDERPVGEFDSDWFAADLQAGATYAVAMCRVATATRTKTQGNPILVNPALPIRDPEGNQLTWDGSPWDTGRQTAQGTTSGEDVRVSFTAPDTGTYHLVMSSPTQETGSYRFSGIESATNSADALKFIERISQTADGSEADAHCFAPMLPGTCQRL